MQPPTLQQWEKWFATLRDVPLILVEGKKDALSLSALGITNVKMLDGPLHDVIDRVHAKRCVILTDLDDEGKKLHGRLRDGLQRNGVIVDDKPRTFLFNTPLRHVEGLATFLRTAHIDYDDWLR